MDATRFPFHVSMYFWLNKLVISESYSMSPFFLALNSTHILLQKCLLKWFRVTVATISLLHFPLPANQCLLYTVPWSCCSGPHPESDCTHLASSWSDHTHNTVSRATNLSRVPTVHSLFFTWRHVTHTRHRLNFKILVPVKICLMSRPNIKCSVEGVWVVKKL